MKLLFLLLIPTVINFDFARDVKSHVHRIGRTARAGASGQALSLVGPSEEKMLEQVEKYLIGTSVQACGYMINIVKKTKVQP